MLDFEESKLGKSQEILFKGKGEDEFEVLWVGGRRQLVIKVGEPVQGKAAIGKKLEEVRRVMEKRSIRPKL